MNLKIKTYDGYELYARYDTIENAKGCLVFSHGFVEYSAHFTNLVALCHQHGYNLFRYDLRGHGRSSMPLGDVKHFEDYADDLNRCVMWVRNQDSSMPIFTMGFSLGGMITVLYGIMYPYAIEGQIILGAGLLVQHQFEAIDHSIDIPTFLKLMGTEGDRGIKQLLAMDSPYILKEASADFLHESLIKAQTFIWGHVSMVQLPILILHGRHDPIIDVKGSEAFFEAIPAADKRLKIYEDQYHDLLRIKEARTVMEDIAAWCDVHL